MEPMALDEVDDQLLLGDILDVDLDALQGIVGGSIAEIEMPVRLCDLIYSILGSACTLEDEGVDTGVGDGVVGHYCEGGHIAVDTAPSLDEHPLADIAALMDQSAAREDRIVADIHVAGYLDTVAEHTVIADRAVMPDMRLRHDEGIVAYAGDTFRADASIDDDMLADLVVVADYDIASLLLPAEVLRSGRYYGVFEDLVAIAEPCSGSEAGIGMYDAVVADLDILVDEGEGFDDHVLAELGLWVDICQIADFTHG